MNVSHEHSLVWWTKPHMGEKIVATNFSELNFVKSDSKNGNIPIDRNTFSYMGRFPENCENYSLIMSVRNPYFQIINHFLNISETNWSIKTNSLEQFKETMNNWVFEIFSVDRNTLLSIDNLVQHILPYKLEDKRPDFVIRYENLFEDLKKFPLLVQKEPYFNNNLVKDNSLFELNTLTTENAKLIYSIHKKTFEDYDYDPFSFSTHDFTLKEKVDFIHN